MTPAILTVSDGPTYNYGPVVVTGSLDKTLTVTNSGSLPATSMVGTGLTAPFVFKGGAYPGTGGSCAGTLNAAATCTVVVSFEPTATGPFSGTLNINYQDGAQAQTAARALQGTGAPPASITISDGVTYSFGIVANGSTHDKTFTLTNGGGVPANSMTGSGLSAPYSFKGGAYPGTGGSCGATLAAAATCTVVVNYNPSTIATHNATLSIDYNNALAAVSSTRGITGQAVAPANITVSDGATYDFGTLATGATADKIFTLTNAGGFASSSMAGTGLAAPFTFKGGTYPGTGGNCGATLNAAATCTIVVSYSPVATGSQSDSIEINYYDGANNQTSLRAIQGTGAAPATLTISDGATYNYGTVAAGSMTDKSFTVTNSGGVSAVSISGGGLSAPFGFKGGTFPGTGGSCTATLSASGTCTIVVTYNPTVAGTDNGSISVTYNDGVTSQSTARAVTGTAVAPASIDISDGPTFNFGSVANGSSNDKTFTLTNNGTFGASSMTGAGLGAPYTYKGGSYPGSGGTCSTTLASAATCTIVVNFSPVASGTHNSSITVNYNNGAIATNSGRAVTGISAPPAVLAISDGPTYDFGTKATGSSTDKSFNVQNTGGVPATSVAGTGLAAPFTYKGGTYPGTGGTCSTTIAASATCTVVVTYAPSGTGPQSSSIDLGYTDGVTNQTSSRAVQGIGAAPASLAISDGPTYNYGNIANGGTVDKSFTVTNSGGVAGTSLSGGGISAPYTFKGGTFPGTGGNCTTSLAASATCTMVITFAPTSAGVHNSTVSLSYDNGVSTQSATRDLTGTGVTPAILTLSDGPTFDFGAVVATGSADKSFTLTNSGSLQATGLSGAGLTAPFTYKGGSFPGTGGNCGATLAPAATCTVVVNFTPSVTGSFSQTMNVSYNDGAQAQSATRAVQGTGASPASITISNGATFNFGTVANGSSQDQSFTLTNGGGVSSSSMTGTGLSAPFSFKGGSYPGTGGNCGAVLAAAATCTVVVNYNPSTIATHNGQFDIGYNNGLSAQTSSRPVQGTAVAPASLSFSDGPTYDFGILATGGTADKVLTVTNGGAFAASSMSGAGLAAPFTFKGGSYPGTGGNCGTTLNAAATCTVVVTYSPSSTGAQSDSAELNYYDGANNQMAARALQGTGANPALLTISDGATYNFGTVASGSSSDKSFIVTNTGGVSATGVSGGGLAAPYSFKGGTYPGTGGTCSSTMTAGATCSVVVTYNPTNIATHNDQIDIDYTNGVSAQSVGRPVTGTAVAPATITISDGTTYNFGTRANGSSTDKSFTLTNTGSFTASTVGGSGLAAPYTFKGGSYPGTGGTCASTMAPAATCTVIVTFAPTSSGTHNGQIDINYNNGVNGVTSSRGVTGIGAPPATLAISDGATFSFGTKATGSSTDKTFTVTNTGGIDATSVSTSGLAAPFTFLGGSYPGTGGTCGTTIAASAICTVVVNYAPVSTGAHSGSIDFTFNDGVTASQTSSRPVQGTGAAPATLTISDGTTYSFGSIANGGAADKSFTITNTGGVTASSMTGSGLAAPFTFKGGSYPGTGGTCGGTLNATLTCTVVVTFAPTVAGLQSDTMNIGYNNGVSGQSTSRDMEGTGVAPALLTLSDGPTFDYGAVVATGSMDKSFTVTNSGSLAATTIVGTGITAPFTYKGGAYPGTGGNCGGTLNAAATCTIVVTFNPSVTGGFNDTIELTYNDGAQAQTGSRDVQGNGATPASISISDGATFSFGNVAQGSSNDKTFTLTNGGGVASNTMTGSGLAAPYSFKGGSYPGTGGNCGAVLSAAATCTIVVNYNPSTINTHTDTIDIGYNNGLSAQTSSRPMTGTAVAPASITISDGPTYDYLIVATGAAADKTFTLTNGGSFAASSMAGAGLAAPFTFKGGAYPGTGGNCSTTLNSGATCTIVVTYLPSATGTQTDTVEINYNNGATGVQATVGVQGTGANPALLTINEGAVYNYGSVANGTTTDKSFIITNSGGVPSTAMSGAGLAAPYSFKGGSYPGTGGSCAGSLAASGTCTVVVTFAPTITGTHNDTIEIAYTDGVTAQQADRAITGTSNPPATLTISDGGTYNYGTKANGSSTDKTFTVTNTGAYTATSMTGSGLAAPYTFKGGSYPGTGGNCSTTLAGSNATCTIVVTFAPSATGTHNDQIEVNYNNGISNQMATRDVTGVGAPPALLAVSETGTYDFGTKATGSSTDKSFTVTNSGGINATSASFAAMSAPFTYKGGTFPGTGGNCGATINASASCTVVITYAPVATGTQSEDLEITYDNGVTASATASRPMQGTGASPATITISDASPYNFGSIANGGSADKSFTLTNTGGVQATGMTGGGIAAPFTFKGGSYPGTGGNCAGTLNAAATCTVVVTFAPTVAGAQTDDLDITFNNGVAGGQVTSRTLNGTGVAPATLTITDGPTYDFGAVVATGTKDYTLTVQNTGSLAATTVTGTGLAAPFTFKGGSYPGTGGNCGGTINASVSCTIVVTFSPTVTGSFSDTIDLNFYNGVSNVVSSRDVQGTGATAASITISDGTTFSFGNVAQGSTQDKTFTLTNGGGVTANTMAGSGLSAPYSFKGGSYPGTGGNCSTTLAAAATCTIVVNYNPSTAATHTATIDVTYNDGLTGQTAQRGVTGTAVAPANITISDGATYDYFTVATGASLDKSFTLTNAGAFTASSMTGAGLAAPFTFKGGGYPGTGGNCGATLNPAATCTIVVTYAPTATGTQTDTIEIPYFNGATSQTSLRAVQGTGASPALLTMTDNPTYSFGSKTTGTSTDRSFTISNSGGVPAASMSGGGLAAPFTFKGGGYPGTGGNCSTSLAAGANCTIVVTYAPLTAAAHSDTIEVAYNDGVNAQTLNNGVTGTGTLPGSIDISDGPTYDFGALVNTAGADKVFTLNNPGGSTVTTVGGSGLAAPFTFKGGSYPGSGGNCGVSIAAGASCTIVVRFSPTADGAYNDTIEIGYNNGFAGQTATRDVTGSGAPAAVLNISDGATYSYGTLAQGGTADKSFTVTNNGGVTATALAGTGLAAPYSFKGGSYPGTGGNCGATLASTLSCTIVVTYNPTTVATHTDSIEINYTDGLNGQTSTRALTGTAVSPASLTISETGTYDFGTVATGVSVDKSFTVTNGGSFSASSMAGAGLAAPYTFKGGSYPGTGGNCSTSLAAAGSCTIVVTYAPTATGTQADTIEINYNNGASAQQATRGVTGVGALPAVLTLSDAGYDYGLKANGSSHDKTFIITNGGGVTASSISGGGLAAPFTFKGGGYPGTGGSCTATLAASQTCSIVVTFAPLATNSFSDTIEITYADGSGATPTANRAILGSSAAPSVLTVSDGATYDYGTIITNSSADKSFTITNTGAFTASSVTGTGLAAPYTFKGGSFPGSGGNCGATIAPAGTCTVVVTFNPTTNNTFNDTMDITYNDGVTTQISSRPLVGAGGPAANIAISDGATFNFNTVANGSTNEKVFTLTNNGGATATTMTGAGLAAPYSFKGGSYPGTGGNCGATLTGSATCQVVVVYSPTTIATHTDTMEISYFDGAIAQQSDRPLTGTAVAPATLSISETGTYDYGVQPLTKATDHTFTVTNNGSFSSSGMSGSGLSAPFAFKGGSYPGTGGNCGAALAPAASCNIVVTYTPTATGAHSGQIDVNYNNGVSLQTASRGVQGLGATVALLAISDGPTYNYGTRAIGLTGEKTFTVSNSGGVAATSVTGGGLASPYFYKGGTYPGTGGNCSSTIAAAGSCSIVVVFTPASTGTLTDTIEVGYSDGLNTQSATRDLTGVGANPANLTISNGPLYNFGSINTGATADHSFTVSNTGGVTATSVTGFGLSAPFTFKGGAYPGSGGNCGNTLAASDTCNIVVTFAPTVTGLVSEKLEMTYNDAVTAQAVDRDMQGTGAPPAAPTALSRQAPAASPNNITNITVRVSGVAQTDVVRLFTDAGCTAQVASGTVGVGATTIDLAWNGISTDGAYTLYANRTNANGTASACSTATASYTLDTTPPVLTAMVNQVPGRSPHWSRTPTMRVTGTFANDTIRIYSDACTTQVTSATATGLTADIVLPTIPTEGTYTYYARAEDTVGNATACLGVPVTYNYDVTDVTVTFNTNSQIVNENTATVTIPLTMSASKPYATTLYYKSHGSAVGGSHMSGVSTSGTIVFPANQTTHNFTFAAPNNGTAEKDKYVDLVLYDTAYEYVHAAGKIYHRVLIKDNDSAINAPYTLPRGNGYAHACFVDGNQKVNCVGANTLGMVGDSTTTDRNNYQIIDGTTSYTQVTTGRNHSCGLTAAGAVKCWGSNLYGQLGGGVVNSPVNMTTPQTVSSLGTGNKYIAAGAYFTCAIKSDDKLFCWGRNNSRQIGDNTTTSRATPVQVDAGNPANTYTKVTLGDDHACAIRTGGSLWCWGGGAAGATGNGSTANAAVGTLYNTDSANTFIDIAAGDNHTCGVTSANKLRCWGENSQGQLGIGSTTDTGTPQAVNAAVNYTQVVTGRLHTCAIVQTANTMKCAGNNAMGQHFDRAAEQVTTMYDVAAGLTFTKIAAFEDSTWGQLTSNEVYYAGSDTVFPFSGDDTTTLVKTPTVINDAEKFSAIDQGWGERANCGIVNSKIRCSGFGSTEGLFGIGSEPLIAGSIWVDAKNDYIQVATGRYHMCAIRSNNKLFCAGHNVYSGTGVLTNVLTAVDATRSYKYISVGFAHTCAIAMDDTVRCWGAGASGRLGNGGTGNVSVPPASAIDSGTTYSTVSAGYQSTCGVTTSGDLKCWGEANNYQLGSGSQTDRTTPFLIGSGYATVSMGYQHACGITTGGGLKCWGYNGYGQLGINSTTQQTTPVDVDAGNTYSKIAVSVYETCAITTAGALKCAGIWTQGISGQTDVNYDALTNLDSGTVYSDISGSYSSMCGRDSSNEVRCWGNNFYNTFGNTTNNWFPDAVPVPGFNQ